MRKALPGSVPLCWDWLDWAGRRVTGTAGTSRDSGSHLTGAVAVAAAAAAQDSPGPGSAVASRQDSSTSLLFRSLPTSSCTRTCQQRCVGQQCSSNNATVTPSKVESPPSWRLPDVHPRVSDKSITVSTSVARHFSAGATLTSTPLHSTRLARLEQPSQLSGARGRDSRALHWLSLRCAALRTSPPLPRLL